MLLICALPPPVHGQSIVHSMLDARLRGLRRHAAIDIGPGTGHGWRYHATRLGRVVRAARSIPVTTDGTVYLSSEAGFGVLYLILLTLMARLAKKRIIMHHHVYSYITRPDILHKLSIALAGKNCYHIVFSEKMKREFKQRYGAERQCIVLNNAIFVDRETEREPQPHAADELVVGFIGRLEESKGFDTFLQMMARWSDEPRVRFVVAGDCEQTRFAADIRAMRAELGSRLATPGFVQGAAKAQFYDDIDVLVFPSRYRNEASPMVVYEALAAGVPCVVTRVGAVEDLVTADCGRLLELDDHLDVGIDGFVQGLLDDPSHLAERRAAARQRFLTLRGQAESAFSDLVQLAGS